MFMKNWRAPRVLALFDLALRRMAPSTRLAFAAVLLIAAPATGGNVVLVSEEAAARAFVPTDSDLGVSWTGGDEPFDDSLAAGWQHGNQGVGFDDCNACGYNCTFREMDYIKWSESSGFL